MRSFPRIHIWVISQSKIPHTEYLYLLPKTPLPLNHPGLVLLYVSLPWKLPPILYLLHNPSLESAVGLSSIRDNDDVRWYSKPP